MGHDSPLTFVASPLPNAVDDRIARPNPSEHKLIDERRVAARSHPLREGRRTIRPDFAVAVFAGVIRAARRAISCGTMTLDAARFHAVSGLGVGPRPARY